MSHLSVRLIVFCQFVFVDDVEPTRKNNTSVYWLYIFSLLPVYERMSVVNTLSAGLGERAGLVV